MDELTTPRAVTLYVGALLGPGVLLLPGLAAEVAGPASTVAWGGLLLLSGLLATVFGALGRAYPGRSGAAGFAGAAFGPRAERAVAVCFLGGAVLGAPVVCLIGASYAARPLGGGPGMTTALAAVLLLLVVTLTASGGRSSARVQLGLVGVLIALVAVAVLAAAPHARAGHWTPFAPHGWVAVGTASSVLMLSFVGWEAVSPLTARLRSPRGQLPRVIAAAFVVTSVLYLALAGATVGVLGPRAGSPTPVADLLATGVGPAGALVAAVAAVALTLAATNAYLTGAAAMTTEVSGPALARRLPVGVAAVGVVLLVGTGTGWWSTTTLVAIPTVLFLAVYVAATAAGVRLLTGGVRVAAAAACVVVTVVLAFAGPVALVPVLVVGTVVLGGRRSSALSHC
ncbi:amino acid permease [Actinomycetospora termitidis]|uniref:Amino acid permease n=1 Tax=Actinomycetospora termitidis TaxID=3053470 RepID=A0ABT7M4A7_9PSEU|nr:amino acid permease [Actinomycetospora sp. Odt1-22]MDL5155512.1 amino acid permease [Actinomycetospora sp. Odt1-22]